MAADAGGGVGGSYSLARMHMLSTPSPAQGRCCVPESPSSSEPNGPPSFSNRCSQVFGWDTAPLVGQTEAGVGVMVTCGFPSMELGTRRPVGQGL